MLYVTIRVSVTIHGLLLYTVPINCSYCFFCRRSCVVTVDPAVAAKVALKLIAYLLWSFYAIVTL